jgi:Xaa-Pro aminopeptidase
MFPSTTYTGRRAKLRKLLGSGIVLLPGNIESAMNFAANPYRFRQDSNFLYYIGIDLPGIVAVFDLDEGTETLFGDELTMDDIVWMGPQPTLRELAKSAGIMDTAASAELKPTLDKARRLHRTIHYLPPYRGDNVIRLGEWLEKEPAAVKPGASVPLIRAVVSQRSVKSDEEIVEIEKAVRITNRMHLKAMQITRPGMHEAQIAAAVQEVAASSGNVFSFPPIISVDGQILHNHHQHNILKSGQMLLVDTGSESLMHYAGDMTRTFPVDTEFTTRQREIYQVVLDSMEAAIKSLRPGIRYREVHLLSAKTIAEGLKALGLMKGDMNDAVEAGAHALFFQHGLGHMMGLDVHDMEDVGENYVGYTDYVQRSDQFGLGFLRLGKELEEGYVLTVEPGIYFIPQLIDMWKKEGKLSEFINYNKVEAYKDFGGIRIEDDFVITRKGARLLGDQVPKTVKDVEAVRKG